MSNIFEVGTSALNSLQRAISTTGNNIANVNTDGYSRQRVEFSSRHAQYTSGYALGTGVEISSIHRAYDQFLTDDVRARTSSSGYYSLFADTASQIDNLMADPATSISAAMDQLFAAMEAVSNSPGSQPQRQVLLSEAQTLAKRFNYVDERLSEVAEDLNQRMGVFVEDINRHLNDVNNLNEQIRRLERSSGGSPNELLDERDRVIESLSKIMRIDARTQDDGSINLYTAGGYRLVSQAGAETLRIAQGAFADGPVQIYISAAGATETELNDQDLGGELGAATDVALNLIDRARRDIGLLAVGLTETFNSQHQQGETLDGNSGANFFGAISPLSTPALANSGAATVTAAIEDVTQLTGDSYRVDYTDSVVTLTNLTTNEVQEINGTSITVEGVTLTVSPASNLTAGDSFRIEPAARAASSMSVALTDTSEIAAAIIGEASGDNQNMLALIDLRDANNLRDGSQSVYDLYTSSVAKVAVDTRSAQANAETEMSLLNSVTDKRASITGVNLEEEAANLIRYQQAYQAAAQIISSANDLFDSVIRATSR